MLTDLPFELVDAIAQFLGYRDLVSLKLTCKTLQDHVQFVKVRHLNVFIESLPHEGKLFHSDESLIYAESLTACPAEKILSPSFQDRFRHLKRLTIQQKIFPFLVFILEQDINCFEQLEHLELRAFEINEGGCLRLKELRVLLVEMAIPARYVVDCEQLTAIHFTDAPEIVHPNNLRHVSFIDRAIEMSKEEFVGICRNCPNLTRLTLSPHTFDSSLSLIGDFPPISSNLYDFLLPWIMHPPDPDMGLICKNQLRCLERIELDSAFYWPSKLSEFRETIRGFIPPSRLWEDVGSPGKEVFERLKFYFGSQDLVNDEKFDELLEAINNQFEEFENPQLNQLKTLNLFELTYSDLAKFQRPMESFIPSLRYISIDKKENLTGESLLYRLANLRQLLINGNRLDESILNQFTRQFKYLELLGLADCVIQGESLVLLPNRSVHLLMIENCTCSDLNFLKSFENVKYLYLFKLELEKRFRFRSILEFRHTFSSILNSLSYLMAFGQETLGILCICFDKFLLSPKIASTIKEMKFFIVLITL